MPEVGGRSLAGDLRALMDDVRKTALDTREQLRAELEGMAEDIKANGQAAVRKVREERAETNKAFADLLGNEMGGAEGGER